MCLLEAVSTNNVDLVETLLSSIPAQYSQHDIDLCLMIASEAGSTAVLDLLLKYGANTDPGEEQGGEFREPALISASRNGLINCVEKLIDHGANIDVQACDGKTPLLISIHPENERLVSLLLRRGANTELCNGNTPLIEAICWGTENMVEILINAGCNTQTREANGNSPLKIAAMQGSQKMVTLLLQAGVNIESPGNDGETVLCSMSWQYFKRYFIEDLEMVSFLLNNGADISAPFNGHAVRHFLFFVMCQNLSLSKETRRIEIINEIIELLFARSDNLDEGDKNGKTFIMQVSRYGLTDLTRVLLDKGVSVCKLSNDGSNALRYAVEYNHISTAELLLHNGAEPNYNTENQWMESFRPSILINPLLHDRLDMVKLLIKFGCKPQVSSFLEIGRIFSNLIQPESYHDHTSIPKMGDILYKSGFCTNHELFSILHNPETSSIWESNSGSKAWLSAVSSNPMSLLGLTRIVISKYLSLKPNRLSNVDQLSIPVSLRYFLKYDDI